MNIAFHNSVSGIMAYQQDMDTLAHNMANVNTTGYKLTRTSFEDLLYTRMDAKSTDPREQVGHGVRAARLDLINTQGTPIQTGMLLDFALVGDGYFAVERNGRVEYTRNGAFDISMEGTNGFLVSGDGGYVLDGKGKRIQLTRQAETGQFQLDKVGSQLGVYNFSNPFGLTQVDTSSFIQSDISGVATVWKAGADNKKPYQLVQNALESSNVNIGQEMVDVIVTQRAYQMNAKMVQTADQLEEIINNLRA